LSLIKIRRFKNKGLAVASFSLCLAVLISIAGCSAGEVIPEEETIIEETIIEENIETEPLEEEVEETEKPEEETETPESSVSISDLEIKGDINMLSGLEISDSIKNERPIAVMVENSPDSRPQSGLIKADIVFEVVDEYGITRYVAIFSTNEAEIIGPARSARIYYAEIARSFDPIYVFWGTYSDAYPVIKSMDMDVLDANSDRYVPYTDAGWRDTSRSNITEHTAFIDIKGIKEDAESYGYSLNGGQSPMRFKLDAVDSERGSITDISVNFSHAEYMVDFSFNPEENKYYKYLAGSPHIDFESGQQISVNNIVVLITNIDGPIDDAGHMVVRTTGTHDAGKAYYFMDGNIVQGTWGRNSISSPFEFKDNEDNDVLFNRGSTWVCMIQNPDRLSY
jgi:hypothetical protein